MPPEIFRTSDLALAAYLKVRKHSIREIEHDSNGKGTFVFEDSPERPGHSLEFYDRRGNGRADGVPRPDKEPEGDAKTATLAGKMK